MYLFFLLLLSGSLNIGKRNVCENWINKGFDCREIKYWLIDADSMVVCGGLITQSCDSCNLMDFSPPGFFVHGISQARILDWVVISFSRFSQPSKWTSVSCITGRFFTNWATWFHSPCRIPSENETSLQKCFREWNIYKQHLPLLLIARFQMLFVLFNLFSKFTSCYYPWKRGRKEYLWWQGSFSGLMFLSWCCWSYRKLSDILVSWLWYRLSYIV